MTPHKHDTRRRDRPADKSAGHFQPSPRRRAGMGSEYGRYFITTPIEPVMNFEER
ncbi:MAG TPA: hypothetical protein VGE45_18260 [Chloroflexia bacterium]